MPHTHPWRRLAVAVVGFLLLVFGGAAHAGPPETTPAATSGGAPGPSEVPEVVAPDEPSAQPGAALLERAERIHALIDGSLDPQVDAASLFVLDLSDGVLVNDAEWLDALLQRVGEQAAEEAAPEPAPARVRPKPTPKPSEAATNNSAPADNTSTTVNDFIGRGNLTLVRGTLGDERSDQIIATQIGFVRPQLGNPPVVDDTTIDAAEPDSWPSNPVLYGGPHVNSVLAALGDALPLSMTAGTLSVGDQTFSGDAIRLITVVPAHEGTPSWPEFLLYAGTGTPGVEEINDVFHGPQPLVIADGFGPLHTGTWTDTGASLSSRAPRIEWRSHSQGLRGPATVDTCFPSMIPADPKDAVLADAILLGLTEVLDTLKIDDPVSVTVYVHPDVRSKMANSGKGGDGHAVIADNALHVLTQEPQMMQALVAHEGTHVLAYHALGPPATSFVGEGLAVWVANQYGGKSLHEWEQTVKGSGSAKGDRRDLVGPAFRQAPEAESYPFAGLFMRAAVHTIGLDAVREHLIPATADRWDAALEAAGTSHAAIVAAIGSGEPYR